MEQDKYGLSAVLVFLVILPTVVAIFILIDKKISASKEAKLKAKREQEIKQWHSDNPLRPLPWWLK